MIICFDIETYEYDSVNNCYTPVFNTNKFVIGCVKTDTGITEFFYNANAMKKWIDDKIIECNQKGRRVYIYGHHVEYDWYGIGGDDIISNNIKYIIFNPFLAIYRDNTYISDSMSFYKMPLSSVGELLNFKKLDMPKSVKNIGELKQYVKRDVDIVLKGILNIKNQLKELGFRPRKLLTAGQVGMTCFLTYCKRNYSLKYFCDYNKEKKRMEIVKPKNPDIVRQAYRGGVNQALKTGKFKNVTLIDINGLYGDVMRKMDFPDLRSEVLVKKPKLNMFLQYVNKDIGVVQCKIKAPNTVRPILPIRYGDYQMFPSNTMLHGTWTFAEISVALKKGYVIEELDWCLRWDKLYVDKNKFNPFKPFIEELYAIEKKCDSIDKKSVIKMIRNNLYGKFAQNRKNKEYVVINRSDSMQYVEKGFETKSKFGKKYVMIKETDTYIPSYTNAILSVMITALGRLRILEESEKIPYDDLLYMDTDSLMFKDKYGDNLKKFKISKDLGDFKIECEKQDCKILGEKRYYIGNNVKLAGVPSKLRTLDVIDNEKNIKIKKMFSVNSAFQTNNWDKIGTFYEEENIIKTHSKNMIPLPYSISEINN